MSSRSLAGRDWRREQFDLSVQGVSVTCMATGKAADTIKDIYTNTEGDPQVLITNIWCNAEHVIMTTAE